MQLETTAQLGEHIIDGDGGELSVTADAIIYDGSEQLTIPRRDITNVYRNTLTGFGVMTYVLAFTAIFMTALGIYVYLTGWSGVSPTGTRAPLHFDSKPEPVWKHYVRFKPADHSTRVEDITTVL